MSARKGWFSRVRDFFSPPRARRPEVRVLSLAPPSPLPDVPAEGLVSAQMDPWFDAYTPNIRGMTPQRVGWIFRQAAYGFPIEQCRLFEWIIENDGHLRSQLETRRDSVAGKEWIVQAGGDDAIDHLAAEALEDALRLVPNFTEVLEHQLEAPWYGYAASEIMWDVVDGVIAPVWFANLPHQRVLFDQYDDPRVITTNNMAPGVPMAPGAWFFSKRKHRRTAMAGLMRTATWWALFKRMSVRDWVSFCERFGLPMPLGKYPNNAPKEEKDVLLNTVAKLGRDAYGVMSEDMNIEFAKVDVSGAQAVHPELAAFCNAEISKVITGATLTSGEGTSAGSYALGRVHENVSFNIVMSDALRLGNWFAQQIGVPFIRWNGFDAKPPRLRINVVREMDPVQRLNGMSLAQGMGVEISKEQVRQENQYKAPTGPDDVLKREIPPAGPPVPQKVPSEVG